MRLPAKTGVIPFRTLECPIYRVHPAVAIASQPVPQTPGALVLGEAQAVHAARAQMGIGNRVHASNRSDGRARPTTARLNLEMGAYLSADDALKLLMHV